MGVSGATFVSFILAEIGDKTQLDTVARAKLYTGPLLAVIGIIMGVLLADAPAVPVSDKFVA